MASTERGLDLATGGPHKNLWRKVVGCKDESFAIAPPGA
jgi:hypothetical protein